MGITRSVSTRDESQHMWRVSPCTLLPVRPLAHFARPAAVDLSAQPRPVAHRFPCDTTATASGALVPRSPTRHPLALAADQFGTVVSTANAGLHTRVANTCGTFPQ